MLSPKVIIIKSTIVLDKEIPSCTRLFQPPVYEELLYQCDGKGTMCKCSSDSLLLNAERLGNLLGSDTARTLMDDMRDSLARPSVSDGDVLTDDQIIDFIRDRGIQSRSELKSWIDAIDSRSDEIKDFFAYIKAQYPLKNEPKEDKPKEDKPKSK